VPLQSHSSVHEFAFGVLDFIKNVNLK
jgi:hypothetical protein